MTVNCGNCDFKEFSGISSISWNNRLDNTTSRRRWRYVCPSNLLPLQLSISCLILFLVVSNSCSSRLTLQIFLLYSCIWSSTCSISCRSSISSFLFISFSTDSSIWSATNSPISIPSRQLYEISLQPLSICCSSNQQPSSIRSSSNRSPSTLTALFILKDRVQNAVQYYYSMAIAALSL